MQLNTDGSGSSLQSEINITPLVDVVLVLLIIFMVVVPLLMQGYDVDIPRPSSDAAPAQAAEARLILSIDPARCRILEPPAGDGSNRSGRFPRGGIDREARRRKGGLNHAA